jgi:hypothetical protein
MMTTALILGLLGSLAFAIYVGKRMEKADNQGDALNKVKKINEQDKNHDETTADIIKSLDSPSVLYKRRDR